MTSAPGPALFPINVSYHLNSGVFNPQAVNDDLLGLWSCSSEFRGIRDTHLIQQRRS